MVDSAGAARVELVVKLTPAAAPGTVVHDVAVARAADLGIVLEPLDPSASDPELGTYHLALVRPDIAARAIEQLQQCEGVEAAFIKPRGEPLTGGMQHGK